MKCIIKWELILFFQSLIWAMLQATTHFCWDCEADLISNEIITIEASDEYSPAAVPRALVQNTLLAHTAAYSWLSSDCLSVKHQWENKTPFKPGQVLYHITLAWRWLWHPHHWTSTGILFIWEKHLKLPAVAPLVVSDVSISATWYHHF